MREIFLKLMNNNLKINNKIIKIININIRKIIWICFLKTMKINITKNVLKITLIKRGFAKILK